MNLSEHFSLEELVFSSTAVRLGLDNTPTPGVIANLTTLAMGLELVRKALGFPMHIDSGYRSPKVNKAVGGAVNSAHLMGYAADFTCAQFGTPLEIVRLIAKCGFQFDQIIQEGTWVHISFDLRARRQVLTAHFGPGGTTYTSGI
jgi:Peptidase M15